MPKQRSEVPLTDRWNVEALYPSAEVWEDDFKSLSNGGRGEWPELASFRGKLKEPSQLKSLLDLSLNLDRKLSKLITYAHLRHDEDLGDDFFKSQYGRATTLAHHFRLETSWIEPELLLLSDQEFNDLLASPDLSLYRFHLEKVNRMRPHTLTPEKEELLALSGKALETSHKAFSALTNADLAFPSAIDAQGNEHPLSHASYLAYLRSSDRTLRKSAFQNLHRSFETHANTLAELLQGEIESHLFQARARNFSSCLESALFPFQVEPAVYENLIASIHKGLPLLQEYLALRKKVLNVDELHFYDLYVPLFSDGEFKLTYDEARAAVSASVAPLGQLYQEALTQGLFRDRWVDVYENARKRSGAYSSGCYDSMPYILMNYQGTLNDVLTLAHEAGHSMHSYLSRKHQPYVDSQYPIFVAEVASTFNEQLLLHHLKQKETSKAKKIQLLQYELEGIRATIFRQTLFAEFELQLHKWAEEGVPFTPALLKEKYLELNRLYYGSDIALDPEVGIEWSRIPHFYYNFYVYQYATGLSAALALFEGSLNSPESTQKYLAFLSSGGSAYPLDLLKKAGVDLRTSEPVDRAMARFGRLLGELKEVLGER